MVLKLWLYRLNHANRAILTNAFTLVGTTAVTSGLGFVYWWLAARLFSAEAVGLASAAISSMILLGTVSMLGLGTLLMGELPQHTTTKLSFIVTALLVAGAVGGGLGLVFAWIAPYLTSDLQNLAGNLETMLLFAAGVALSAVTLVFDQALIGLLRGGLQLGRNVIFSTVKLGTLGLVGLLLADRLGMTIYTTWLLGNLLSVIALIVYAAFKGVRFTNCRPQPKLLHGLSGRSLAHHALNLALLSPGLLLPVLVTVMLSATTNAHFYVAWMIAGFVFVGPGSLTTVLYAVNAADPAALAHKIRFTLKLAFLLGLIANVGLFLTGNLILSLFGSSYVDQAGWTLRILALGTFPTIIKDHYVAVYRIYGQATSASVRVAAAGLLELSMAAGGASIGGLLGLAVGWLLAMCVEAVLMSRAVIKVAALTPTEQDLTPLPELPYA